MNKDSNFPEKSQFFERGFEKSVEYNPDDGCITYTLEYKNGRILVVTFDGYVSESTVTVKIIENNIAIASFSRTKVNSVAFQSWENEKVIQIYWGNMEGHFLINYEPQPRFFYGEL